MNIDKQIAQVSKLRLSNRSKAGWWYDKIDSPISVEDELQERVSKILSLRHLELDVKDLVDEKDRHLPLRLKGHIKDNEVEEGIHFKALSDLKNRIRSRYDVNSSIESKQYIEAWNDAFDDFNPYLVVHSLESHVLLPMFRYASKLELSRLSNIAKRIVRDEVKHVMTNNIVAFGIYKETSKKRLLDLATETLEWVYE